jgi:hypothetical protein
MTGRQLPPGHFFDRALRVAGCLRHTEAMVRRILSVLVSRC